MMSWCAGERGESEDGVELNGLVGWVIGVRGGNGGMPFDVYRYTRTSSP